MVFAVRTGSGTAVECTGRGGNVVEGGRDVLILNPNLFILL